MLRFLLILLILFNSSVVNSAITKPNVSKQITFSKNYFFKTSIHDIPIDISKNEVQEFFNNHSINAKREGFFTAINFFLTKYHYIYQIQKNGFIISSPNSMLILDQKLIAHTNDKFNNNIYTTFYSGIFKTTKYNLTLNGKAELLIQIKINPSSPNKGILSAKIQLITNHDLLNNTIKSISILFANEINRIKHNFIYFISMNYNNTINYKNQSYQPNTVWLVLTLILIVLLGLVLYKKNNVQNIFNQCKHIEQDIKIQKSEINCLTASIREATANLTSLIDATKQSKNIEKEKNNILSNLNEINNIITIVNKKIDQLILTIKNK